MNRWHRMLLLGVFVACVELAYYSLTRQALVHFVPGTTAAVIIALVLCLIDLLLLIDNTITSHIYLVVTVGNAILIGWKGFPSNMTLGDAFASAIGILLVRWVVMALASVEFTTKSWQPSDFESYPHMGT